MNAVIWGTGKGAEGIEEMLAQVDIVVNAYIDNEKTKHGTFYNGKEIVPPDRMLDHSPDYIIIASTYHDAIRKQIAASCTFDDDKIIASHDGYSGLFRLNPQFGIPYDIMHWDHLQAPIHNLCNLNCRHCIRYTSGYNIFKTSPADYRKILSAFDASKFSELHISADGEISMLKNYRDYFDIIQDLGWKSLFFVTNGTCLDEEYYDFLFRSGLLSKLIISIESPTPEGFEFVRGFPFERFLRFLEMINASREKHASETLFSFSSTCMRSNLHELPDIIEFAALHKVGHVHFFPLKPSPFDHPDEGKICVPEETMDHVPHAERQAIYRRTMEASARTGVQVVLPERMDSSVLATTEFKPNTVHSVCSLPLKHVTVDQNGDIRPCCQMSSEYSLGNVFEATFEDIWNGKRYNALHHSLQVGGKLLPSCEYCTVPKGYCW